MVLRCRQGDGSAWRQLIDLYNRRLLYYIRRLVTDDSAALDALQETWIRVHKSIGRLKDPLCLNVWIYRIARNAAISYWRGNNQADLRIDDLSEFDPNLTYEDPKPENAPQIHEALGKISPAHREILTLHYLEDFSLREIGEILDLPEGTVKSRLHYAKIALKRELLEVEAQL